MDRIFRAIFEIIRKERIDFGSILENPDLPRIFLM
jgi:hypothetical protein